MLGTSPNFNGLEADNFVVLTSRMGMGFTPPPLSTTFSKCTRKKGCNCNFLGAIYITLPPKFSSRISTKSGGDLMYFLHFFCAKLPQVVTQLGSVLTSAEADEFMREADLNGDGKLDYDEFVR